MRIDKTHWLYKKPIAHRGLWGGEIIENSVTAYKNAAEKGFPIEIDLYQSTDGAIYCFHDKTLKRMTGAEGKIFEKTADELDKLRLYNPDGTKSNEKIPTFEEVLEIAEGKVPLLIELKDQPHKDFVEKVIERLQKYGGEFAVQSFNPLYIAKVKKLCPNFIRGILGTDDAEDEKAITAFILKYMPLNFILKPDFISYHHTAIPLSKRKTKNRALLCWTITDKKDYGRVKTYVDNIIFEGFNLE